MFFYDVTLLNYLFFHPLLLVSLGISFLLHGINYLYFDLLIYFQSTELLTLMESMIFLNSILILNGSCNLGSFIYVLERFRNLYYFMFYSGSYLFLGLLSWQIHSQQLVLDMILAS